MGGDFKRADGSVERARLDGSGIEVLVQTGAGDEASGRIFVATLQGNVFAMSLDGSDFQTIVQGAGRLTGICYHRGHD